MNRFNNPLFWLNVWRMADDDAGGGDAGGDDQGGEVSPIDSMLSDLDGAVDGEVEAQGDGDGTGDGSDAGAAGDGEAGGQGKDDADAAGQQAAADGSGADDKAGDGDGADAAADDEAGKGNQKDTVPLATFLDDRRIHTEELAALNQKFGRFEGLQEKLDTYLADKNKAPEPEAPKAPDYLDDPEAHVNHKIGEVAKKVDDLAASQAETAEQTAHREQMEQITNILIKNDQKFYNTNPDYYDAIAFVKDLNIENAKAMGHEDQAAITQAENAMFAVQVQALQRKVDPAELMYSMAKRFGYKAPDPAADDANDPLKKAAAAKKAADDNFDALVAGEKAGSMGGEGEVADPASIEEMGDMDNSEFREAFGELFGKENVR